MSEFFGEVPICSLKLGVVCKQNKTSLKDFEGSDQLELSMVAVIEARETLEKFVPPIIIMSRKHDHLVGNVCIQKRSWVLVTLMETQMRWCH